ncbi:MAG: nickel-dependent lactate racemase [bacterium]
MDKNSNSSRQSIPWGKDGSLEFELPGGWNLLGRMTPAEERPLDSVESELEKVFRKPTGAPPLAELAAGGKKVVIVVDDISRPTPAHLLMGKILEHLESGGTDPGAVTVIPGLGMHRPMSQEEMERKIGKKNLGRVNWENHNYRDQSLLVRLGRTRRGTRAYVNKKVAGAGLVVMVGTIEPHVHAGFGGGFKNILPGVAGMETIARNHAICASPKYFSMVGTEPDENPMRQDIEEVGRMLPGETFMVNTVLNSNGGIVRVVAGDPVEAHREGVRVAAKLFGAVIPCQADVVITSSHPMDIDLRQGVKAVANLLFAAKPGGVIIAAMKCEEGLGSMRVPKFGLALPAEVEKIIVKLLSVAITRIAPPGISEEERFAAYFLFRAILRNKIFLYAPSIAEKLKGRIPFIDVFSDFNEAIRAAHKIRPGADTLIFTHGGITYPIVKTA